MCVGWGEESKEKNIEKNFKKIATTIAQLRWLGNLAIVARRGWVT